MNTIIEKIRAEVERLKVDYLNRSYTFVPKAMQDLLDFISDLEKEEKPMNQEELDDAIDKWLYGRQIIERKNGRVYFQHKPSFSDYQNDWNNEGNAGGADLTADGLRDLARHFAQWGAEHRGSSETSKEDKLRYCVEYINPCFPLLDNGGLNVRHLRVPDEHWAEMAITLILSFGGKIYALYRGNVKDGKLAEWPTPMIVEQEDWFSDEWLHELMDCGHNCL